VKSLRSKILSIILLTVLFNAMLLILAATWGIKQSGKQWRQMVIEESSEKLSEAVKMLWVENGKLTPIKVRETFNYITSFAEELSSFAIYNSERVPVYYWRNQSFPGISPDYDLSPGTAVVYKGKIIGWVSCRPSDFYFIKTNHYIVLRLAQTIIAGLILSILAALAFSRRMAKKASGEAESLAEHLCKLSQGERGIPFKRHNIEEFQSIARAAVRLQETLEKEEKIRVQWTQDIAHDLRTPVAAIKSQIEAIKDGIFELTDERYAMLEKEFTQIDKLVKDLSLLSRMESPEIKPHLETIYADTFLMQIRNRFQASAEAKNLEIEFNASENLSFISDPDLLSRAINNLIQNSIQYSDSSNEKKKITISVTKEVDSIIITIENPGHIPEKDLPNLFERLYRGDSGRSSPGSGLGLAIVKAIADKLGGSLTARNTTRNTVRMRLRLPYNMNKSNNDFK